MKKLLLLTLLVSLCAFSFAADDQTRETKASDRVQAAADVLDDIQGAPDKGIPQEVLGSAECVAVVPSMLKGGFIIGGKYGRGLASCGRTGPSARRSRIKQRYARNCLAGFWRVSLWPSQVRSVSAYRTAAGKPLSATVPAPSVALATGRHHPSREYSEFASG